MPLITLLLHCSWLHPSTPLSTVLSWGRGIPWPLCFGFLPFPAASSSGWAQGVFTSPLWLSTAISSLLCVFIGPVLEGWNGLSFVLCCPFNIKDIFFFFFGCTRSSLQCVDSPVGAHDLSCPTAHGILVPWPGFKPTSYKAHLLHRKVNSQPLGHERSPKLKTS